MIGSTKNNLKIIQDYYPVQTGEKAMTSQTKVQLKWAFYLEGLINLATIIVCFSAPIFFLEQMTSEQITPLSKNLVY